MNLLSPAASLSTPLRRVVSAPDLPRAEPSCAAQDAYQHETLQGAKKQVIAWREQIHERLRGLRPQAPYLAVRVGSNEFGGDDRECAVSARSRLYQTRDLWTLLTLADPSQELVIVHDMLDPDILYYYLRLGVAEGRSSFLSRLGRLRTVLLPSNNFPNCRPSHWSGGNAYANHNLSIRLLGHLSCQKALTAHLKQHALVSDKKPILSLYQNSPRMEGISKILQIDALTTPVPLLWLGSKHGSRQMFEEAQVPHPLGMTKSVDSPQAIALALCAMTHQAPHVDQWMIKITEGTASGNGNGILDLSGVQRPLVSAAQALACMETCLTVPGTQAHFFHDLQERGAIVEAFIAPQPGARAASPSVQGIIDVNGAVNVVSSHEQILDEATGQSYEGCSYPAHQAYRQEIIRYTQQVGERLYAHGARGHFAVDYLATENEQHPSGWRIDAIEINLRETGTTPPFMMMRLLCGGRPTADGVWQDGDGQAKYYVASDSIHKDHLRGVHPQTVIDAVAHAGLEFTAQADRLRPAMTGVVLTLLPGVRSDGKVGCICIANGAEAAQDMRAALERCLDGVRAYQGPPLHCAAMSTKTIRPPVVSTLTTRADDDARGERAQLRAQLGNDGGCELEHAGEQLPAGLRPKAPEPRRDMHTQTTQTTDPGTPGASGQPQWPPMGNCLWPEPSSYLHPGQPFA